MKFMSLLCGSLLLPVLFQVANAQPITVVRTIPGFACLRLNLPREEMISGTINAPVFSAPSPQAPRIGTASAVMIVKTPMNVSNGFVQILFFNGQEGWMQKELLKSYNTPELPNGHCTPAVLSNGRIGFDYK